MYVNGCFNRADGDFVIVELEKLKLPMSLKDLPGFVIYLSKLEKIAHFYCLRYLNKGGRKEGLQAT